MATLQEIAALNIRDRTAAYTSYLDKSLAAPSVPELGAFLQAVADESQVVARQVLSDYVEKLRKLGGEREAQKDILNMSIDKLQPKIVSFEEQVCTLREMYADLLEADNEFSEAAKVLVGIPLESGHRNVKDSYKLEINIRIVRNFLEEEDSTSAERYFNRANILIHSTQDLATQVQFKLCQARIWDYSRKFAEASMKYHEISYVAAIDEQERLYCLSSAIICAVLAPAGPSRSRILSSLYRDERSPQTQHFGVLSKMFLDQMINEADAAEFAKSLKEHQLAKLAVRKEGIIEGEDAPGKKGPENVLDRAVMEHNLLAASRIYYHITFKGLGLLLSLTPSAAESMARTMIQQGRLRATLDQVAGLISFDAESTGTREEGFSNVAMKAGGGGQEEESEELTASAPAMGRWDLQIRQTLQAAEAVAIKCEALLALGAANKTATGFTDDINSMVPSVV